MTTKRKLIWFSLAVVWMLVIWSNSMQTAEESSAVSQGVLSWFIPLLAQTGIPEEFWHSLIRKLAHMTEFAILGMLWCGALQVQRQKASRSRCFRRLYALLICIAAAAVDEIIQRFVPGRSGELRDVCIDLAGGVLGVLIVTLIGLIVDYIKQKKSG